MSDASDPVPPPAPQWFKDALAIAPERSFVESQGVRLEALTWGERGNPGLLFLHGNAAHADWWSFIAPFFARDYRVTAYSLAGMGDSGWRDAYRFELFAKDAEAVARATGLCDGPRKPVYIGHSLGGALAYYIAQENPQQMHAALFIDTRLGSPPAAASDERERRRQRPSRIFPDLTTALSRFRLTPSQPIACPYAADYIARRSLKRVPRPDGSGLGWTWKFDPQMWEKIDRSGGNPLFRQLRPLTVPAAHLQGERSGIRVDPRYGQPTSSQADVLEIEIPDAHHHIMVDQPLALVAAIRAVLAIWRLERRHCFV